MSLTELAMTRPAPAKDTKFGTQQTTSPYFFLPLHLHSH